jgi:hypothetical protein
LWGAQIEARSTATAYTATTTQAITNYIPALQTAASGVARFDNNPTTGESLGLLIEESRTNLVLYSSDFTNGYYSLTNTTLSANSNVAPDGTQTAETLIENTATGAHTLNASTVSSSSAAGAYTLSMYVKSAPNRYFAMALTDNATGNFGSSSTYDLQSGTVIAGSGTIKSVGNGWYRITTTGTKVNTASNCGITLFLVDSTGTSGTYTGNGWGGIFIWGLQLEVGAFATSYIPTVASQVTRAADSASMTGTNFTTWYNTGSGSYYVEAATQLTAGTIETFIQDQSISIGVQGSGGNLRVSSTPAQGNLINTLGTAAYPSTSKIGVSYQQGTSLSLASGNGSTAGTFTYPQSFSTSFGIGTAISGGGYGAKTITGYIKKVAYYPVALTATNLQALTS